MQSNECSIPLVENFDGCASQHDSQISLLCWNVLAQSLLDKNAPSVYTHIKPGTPVSWPERFRMILNEIISANADVVCLQEVEFTAFENDFLPSLRSVGYDGLIQDNPRGGSLHEHGNATFWKRKRLALEAQEHRTRTLTTILKKIDDSPLHRDPHHLFAVINCHLEGHPMKPTTRVKQLQKSLNRLSVGFSHHAVLVCGDFNCELHSSACSAYLGFGEVPCDGGLLEWGVALPEDVSKIPGHRYLLSSAYPAEVGRDDPTIHFTYAQHPGCPVPDIDQIWYTRSSLQCTALRQLFKSDENRQTILRTGLPNSFHPSDHIPIGASFNWRKPGDLVDLQIRKDDVTSQSRPSNWNPLAEAAELLSACPFENDAQREEFDYIVSDFPGMVTKGKPNAEQLAQLEDRRIRKEKLFAELSDEAVQILKKILKLRKEATKMTRTQNSP